ncbi:MAG TPA: SIMPL domain-containing protein [Tepidisphaeraceae bacterium]|nr:SIMPL domain-containing protein [Tepidisphaeraceae bacterium]
MGNPANNSSLPRRIIVTLQAGGFFFSLANVVCVAILGYVYLSSKREPRTLEVKGSAKREITSDIVDWDGTITTRDPDLVKAYIKLKDDADRAAAFIKAAGIPDSEVTFSAINTNKIYQREVIPSPVESDDGKVRKAAPTIVQTPRVEMYELSQDISIESHDMEKVPAVSRSITSLIKDGVEIDSNAPRYLYSKLSELKIDMLGEATRDATARATQIVSNANGALGRLIDAKMGVMQINPKGVTDVSDTGNNDTTSLEKEILAVVTVDFELR